MIVLEPLEIEPLQRPLIWGGHTLAERYGKPAGDGAIGESWECWDANRVRGGAYGGKTIAELRAELGDGLTGRVDPGTPFPLLTKLIDARHALSVQVHPGDAYARRVEGQPVGKSEAWYVLEAEPDASIVLGWKRDTSRSEFLERIATGAIDDVLHRVPARVGDVFYLPAGTLHAIGRGIVLFEAQQASDLTYRVFDYNRRDAGGNVRELHVQKAADVLEYRAHRGGALRPLPYDLGGMARTALVAGPHFWVEHAIATAAAHGLDLEDAPLAVFSLGAPLELEARGVTLRLEPYRTALVPAGLEVVMVRAIEREAAFLFAAPAIDRETLPRRFARAGVPVARSTDFLAQF